MRWTGPLGILWWAATSLLALIALAILVLLILNAILWGMFFQANVLFILANVFAGIGVLVALLIGLLLIYATPGGAEAFLTNHWILLSIISVCPLVSSV